MTIVYLPIVSEAAFPAIKSILRCDLSATSYREWLDIAAEWRGGHNLANDEHRGVPITPSDFARYLASHPEQPHTLMALLDFADLIGQAATRSA